ncbi:MAG TPA: Stk1 family PASTA domain-containing Ser/Thr kinase [Candidatus Onthocola stercorigallinarum]|nr:Stk1 family PASTA domain-containing Ser/Thr kinase [Candidatus Onthocola stercorigallinarum]
MKGQKISDRYQIIKSIGEGGMANVYLAYDTILDRNVAVKVLRGDLATDEKFVRRFQREALSASSLSNPNIVEVYDVGEDNGEYYIVMEYVEGKHLKNLLKKRGKLTVPEVVDIVLQITSGLSVAHDSYIIHRDIKPQNILILDNGLVKITDFGIAVAMNATQLTQTNSVMGSVHYLPPEQASGKGATLQSDIYSIGILMYELLTGKLPFKGDNAVEIALKHLKEPMPSIRDEYPEIPQSVENIILKATAKNPKNRYADAREMHEDLKTCLDESRKNELKITFKYPEHDYDDTKLLKTIKVNEKKEKKKDINTTESKEGEEMKQKKSKKNDNVSQNKIIIILASIFVGLVVIITTIVVLIPYITSSRQEEVPDVSGYTVNEAINALQDAGFIVADEQREEASETIPEGNVTKTSPAAGSIRKEGTEIILYISLGDVTVEIEDYTGQNYNEVKGRLEALNLQVIIERQDLAEGEDPNDYEEGIIIDQSVEPGERLSEGDRITLYIPNLTNQYPNFVEDEYSVSEVEEFASDYGINLAINYEETTEYEPGTIIRQSRAAGTTVVEGARLTITVAAAPGEVEEPSTDGELE